MYKSGIWGSQAKLRSLKRAEYFRERWRRIHGNKDDNPKFYRIGELEAVRLLKGSIDKNKEERSNYDIYWNGYKIDVKTSNLINNRWRFYLSAERNEVDYFLLICFENNKVKYLFLVPDKFFNKIKNFSLSKSSLEKYKKFLIK